MLETEIASAGSQSSSSQGSAGPWENPLNRAIHPLKGRPKEKPPTSAGRVTGYGLRKKLGEYYDKVDPDNPQV